MAHTNLILNPTHINLRELPAEGRSYTYTQEGAELTPALRDVIGSNAYLIQLTVRPMGNVYEAQGKIETAMGEICSLCAMDITLPIREKFHEILLINVSPRSAHHHQARVNHSSELVTDGLECTELESEVFNVGEYVRELIVLARPIKPTGRPDCDQTCPNYQEAVRKGWLTIQKDSAFFGEKPFSALANLKLNS